MSDMYHAGGSGVHLRGLNLNPGFLYSLDEFNCCLDNLYEQRQMRVAYDTCLA
jgi:hypothetical protein